MTTTPQSTADTAPLSARVRGPVHLPGEKGYDTERAGFNRSIRHHPAVVVGATGTADAVAAVEFAAARGLPLAVQAAGHGATVAADGAVLVSTRRMDRVTVDPRRRVARVQAGVRWQDVIDRAAEHGLAPLNGSSPLVGAVSYTLGGGLPVLGRSHGWAADHARRFELVTADGATRVVSPDTETDLFRALRGGGKAGFGLVTSMEIALVPVSRLYGGGLFFTGDADAEVVHTWRQWTETVPESMNSSLALMHLPDVEAIPPHLRGRYVVHIRIAYTGTAEAGAGLVAPLRAAGGIVADTVDEMPYSAIARVHDDPTEPSAYRENSLMLRDLPASAADAVLAEAGAGAQGAPIMTELRHLGGALARRPDFPDAIGHRDAAFSVATVSSAEQPAPDGLWSRIAPWSTGRRFANFLAGPDAAAHVPEVYAPDVLEHLAAVKAAYDPGAVFGTPVP
ncbi:FAD/FMN-containing dehydrogenase [Haloactinopolyspora alba]|uniref:FAD/FMN-containing dehydrogenase n=1 Tax=Haloactinopolyspora alba TaxID=648780 RepID=A0A2P8E274_9ACTN|nr:FAD-binding oxidoreductase [Haloactinopolyspora alba]PSL03581.1 FAD/FMN-containing dehydrogenase [Haloactinopolyspora alba]